MAKTWAKAALIRALKTFAQTSVAMLGTSVAFNEVQWITVLSTSSLAFILSVLTSLAGLPEVDNEQR